MNSAHADGQFPLPLVSPAFAVLRMLTISPSIKAPETKRIVVKLAASILVCLSASRQSNEFPANASMAIAVKAIVRMLITLKTAFECHLTATHNKCAALAINTVNVSVIPVTRKAKFSRC